MSQVDESVWSLPENKAKKDQLSYKKVNGIIVIMPLSENSFSTLDISNKIWIDMLEFNNRLLAHIISVYSMHWVS